MAGFPEEKALQGFGVKDNDISQILKMVDQAAEVIDNATNLYKESRAPLATVPKLAGKRPFDVWAAFTQMPKCKIRVKFYFTLYISPYGASRAKSFAFLCP